MKKRIIKFFQDFYLVLLMIFLYAPIVTMTVLSFNTSKSRTQWGGFTLDWYKEMFQNSSIMDALYNTLLIAFVSALAATILGTLAAMGINSMSTKKQSVIMGISNIPMLNSEIVTGISLMLAFVAFGISLGFKTILISHITFNVPFVILNVMPKLKQTDKSTYEAAMDLGANPVKAFFKVVFPDIMPGVLSGFLMAFTMSLDDFIITHFTRGAGINTLSTLIYSEVRRGIKPSMYALSTLIFVTVLILLLITNFNPEKPVNPALLTAEQERILQKKKELRLRIKRILLACSAFFIVALVSFTTYYRSTLASDNELYVYNWGDYIDEDVVEMFEEETGIHVTYDMFETNEEMYPVIEAGAVNYDVVCPSDYMIQKMIENNMLAEIDLSNLPNIKNIDPLFLEKSQSFDPGNQYSVPYTWGTVGILYNDKRLEELGVEIPDSWEDLWDSRLAGEILMQDSVRDAFMVALKKSGYSMNTTDEDQLLEAKADLIAQKPLVQAYVIDQVRDKMLNAEAAVAVVYSGEMLYIQEECQRLNLDYQLNYVLPKEGSNIWFDSWVIPKNANNKENAEKWIDFLCRPDIAKMNFDYITYSTPNQAAKELLPKEIQENPALFPDIDRLNNCEVFQYLGTDADNLYNTLWKQVKSS